MVTTVARHHQLNVELKKAKAGAVSVAFGIRHEAINVIQTQNDRVSVADHIDAKAVTLYRTNDPVVIENVPVSIRRWWPQLNMESDSLL